MGSNAGTKKSAQKVDSAHEEFKCEQARLYERLCADLTDDVDLSCAFTFGGDILDNVTEFVHFEESDLRYFVNVCTEEVVELSGALRLETSNYNICFVAGEFCYGPHFHDDIVRIQPDELQIIRCHGDKCRLSGENGVWCESCNGEFGEDFSDYRCLFNTMPFSAIPKELVLFIKRESSILQYVDTLDSLSYASRIISNRVDTVNRLQQVIESAEERIQRFTETVHAEVRESKLELEKYSGVAHLDELITTKIQELKDEEERQRKQAREDSIRAELAKLDQRRAELASQLS